MRSHRVFAFAPRLRQFVEEPLRADRPIDIRVGDEPVLRVEIGAALQEVVRELEQHAEALRVADLAIADVAEIVELRLENTRRRRVRLRRQIDDETLGPGDKTACRFTQHRVRIRSLAEKPQFIDQNKGRLLAAHDVGVGRDDLQYRLGDNMRDLAHVFLHVQDDPQFRIRVHHVARRTEGVVRDLHRWRQDQQLGRMTPVANERCHHDAGGDGGLAVLLADQQKEVADVALRGLGVIGAEDRPGEVEHPFFADLTKGGVSQLAGCAILELRQVDDLQGLEDRQCGFRLIGEQRRKRQKREPRHNAAFPVRAGRRPMDHRLLTTSCGG